MHNYNRIIAIAVGFIGGLVALNKANAEKIPFKNSDGSIQIVNLDMEKVREYFRMKGIENPVGEFKVVGVHEENNAIELCTLDGACIAIPLDRVLAGDGGSSPNGGGGAGG